MRFSSKVLRRGFLVLILLLFFCTGGCTSSDIWDIPKETFLTRLKHHNTEFLRHINYDQVVLKDVLLLGDGAGYYMSFVYKELGLDSLSEEMLKIQWEYGEGQWKKESTLLLLSLLVETKQYVKGEEFAEKALAQFPQDPVLYRLYIESMYWQEKSAGVLQGIEELAEITGTDLEGLVRSDPEIHLFYAATMCELDREGWQKQFLSLVSDSPASVFHIRGHDFLQNKGVLKSGFTAMEKQFIEGKYNIAKGYYREAFDLWEPLMTSAPHLMTSDTVIKEAARLFTITEERNRGRTLLLGFAREELPVNPYILSISLGRLETEAGNYRDGANYFEQALEHSSSGRERDVVLRLHMDALFDDDPLAAAAKMDWYVTQWVAPAYYQDILEELCSYLIRERDWTFLLEVYNEIREDADPVTELRYRSAIARAAEAGLLNASPSYIEELEAVPAGDPPLTAAALYYTFLFSSLPDELIGKGVFPSPAGESASNPVRENTAEATSEDLLEEAAETNADSESEQFISGFMRYGLYEQAYALLYAQSEEIRPEFCRTMAEKLAEQGFYYESVVIMKLLLGREGYTADSADYRMLYPQPYYSEMKRLSAQRSLPISIFYGLVREESHFKASIVSHAGAVGLAQMMPSTAEDVAILMRKQEYELTNPSDNLEMGAFYFRKLMKQFDSPSRALFAYNAGPTRVRRWESHFGDLPGPLFLEAIPFKETRHYGRKVLVSAIYYGYFYENKMPDTILSSFFNTNN